MNQWIFVLVLFMIGPAHAAASMAAKELAAIEADYEDLAESLPSSVDGLHALLARIDRLPLKKAPTAVQRGALRMRIILLVHKGSVLESPDFTGNKGGPEVWRAARALCQGWLADHRGDMDFLDLQYSAEAHLHLPVRPTIDKMLVSHPKHSGARALSAHIYSLQDELVPAMHEIVIATRLETKPAHIVANMRSGVDYAERASCGYAKALPAIVDGLPSNAPVTVAGDYADDDAESIALLATVNKARARYLQVYDVQKCIPVKK